MERWFSVEMKLLLYYALLKCNTITSRYQLNMTPWMYNSTSSRLPTHSSSPQNHTMRTYVHTSNLLD